MAEEQDIRLARLEERVSHLFDDMTEARKAREDINQTQEIMRITLGQMEQRFVSIDHNLDRISSDVESLEGTVNWAVKLIIGSVISAMLLAFTGAALAHVFMK